MEKKNLRYSINASAISRYANRNFDLCLRHLPISSGQQFFLLRIYENPRHSPERSGTDGLF